jgi:hypothetical protein
MRLIEIRLEGPGFDLLSQETEYIIINRLLIKFTISLFFLLCWCAGRANQICVDSYGWVWIDCGDLFEDKCLKMCLVLYVGNVLIRPHSIARNAE